MIKSQLKAGYKKFTSMTHRKGHFTEVSRRVFIGHDNDEYTVIVYRDEDDGEEFEEVLYGIIPPEEVEEVIDDLVYRLEEIIPSEENNNNTGDSEVANLLYHQVVMEETTNKSEQEKFLSSIEATTNIYMGNDVFSLDQQSINDVTFKMLSWCENGIYKDVTTYDLILTRMMLLSSMELINIDYAVVVESLSKGVRLQVAENMGEKNFIDDLKDINWDLREAAANVMAEVRTDLILTEPMSYRFSSYNFNHMDLNIIVDYIMASDAKTNLTLVDKLSAIARNSEKTMTKLLWAKLVSKLNQPISAPVKYSIRAIINCLNVHNI